jgi:hypothetical protein
LLLVLPGDLLAQAPDLQPDASAAPVPVVGFEFVMPGASPSSYSLSVDSTGRAAYRSQQDPEEGLPAGDPYIFKFTVSEAARDRIFELARELDYFKEDLNYTKRPLANMGAKILSFRDAGRRHRATYNYSENPNVQELTALMQGISATLEFGRRLDYLHRFERLGLEAELKSLEAAEKAGRVAELQVIEPVLAAIASDRSVLNVARRRAEGVLKRLHPKTQASR